MCLCPFWLGVWHTGENIPPPVHCPSADWWVVFLIRFWFSSFSEGFVPYSDPHWTWKSALAFQRLCDIGAHIPDFHSEMVKPNGFDLITCEDLWHALFRNYLVKRSQIKCLLAPSFSSDLAFSSETLSPPAQGILLNSAISTRVMSCVIAVKAIGHSWCHIPFTFIIYHECPSQDPQGKCQHPQRNLPLKDSILRENLVCIPVESCPGGIMFYPTCWPPWAILHSFCLGLALLNLAPSNIQFIFSNWTGKDGRESAEPFFLLPILSLQLSHQLECDCRVICHLGGILYLKFEPGYVA